MRLVTLTAKRIVRLILIGVVATLCACNPEKSDKKIMEQSPLDVSSLSTQEMREIVRRYVKSQNQSADYWKVVEIRKASPERLSPLLVEVVLESGSEKRAQGLAKEILFETPLKRALTMLEKGTIPEIQPRLLELSSSAEPFVRRDIANHLAAYGSDEVVDATLTLIADPKDPAATHALHGINDALRSGRATEKYKTALFDPVFETIKSRSINGNFHTDILLKLDEGRGAEALKTLLPANDLISQRALGALNRTKINVDPEVLSRLLRENEISDSKEKWRPGFVGSILFALVMSGDLNADQRVRKIVNSEPLPEEKGMRQYENARMNLQEAVLPAYAFLEKFKMPDLWVRYDRLGRDKISVVERDLLSSADGEICNGGFSQYFYNIDYDPREDVEAMKRMGAPEHAAILERSFKAFGWFGPSADRDKRIEQLDKMSEKKSELLGECDDEWFTSTENLEVINMLYAIKNRDILENLQ